MAEGSSSEAPEIMPGPSAASRRRSPVRGTVWLSAAVDGSTRSPSSVPSKMTPSREQVRDQFLRFQNERWGRSRTTLTAGGERCNRAICRWLRGLTKMPRRTSWSDSGNRAATAKEDRESLVRFMPIAISACLLGGPCGSAWAAAPSLDVANVAADAQVRIAAGENGLVSVDWPAGGDSRGTATFRLSDDKPLDRVAVAAGLGRRLAADRGPRPDSVHGDHGRHAESGHAGRLDDLLR